MVLVIKNIFRWPWRLRKFERSICGRLFLPKASSAKTAQTQTPQTRPPRVSHRCYWWLRSKCNLVYRSQHTKTSRFCFIACSFWMFWMFCMLHTILTLFSMLGMVRCLNRLRHRKHPRTRCNNAPKVSVWRMMHEAQCWYYSWYRVSTIAFYTGSDYIESQSDSSHLFDLYFFLAFDAH